LTITCSIDWTPRRSDSAVIAA